jgi:peptidoglycan LD-endopeptidase LytH
MNLTRTLLVAAGTVVVLAGCVRGERFEQPRPSVSLSPRDAHIRAVARTEGSAQAAWEEASRRAVRSGLSIAPGFRERVRFPAGQPHAIAYRFTLREGQTLRIRHQALDGGAPLIADVFHHLGGEIYGPAHTSRTGPGEIRLSAATTGDFVLRLQPEIGGSGLFEVEVDGDSPLVFPVAWATTADIRSAFGAARDGGARRHEGVDIFAPRGTPVVAVADGRISQVSTDRVGGHVIWQTDDASGLLYYYAHLDEHRARRGDWVSAGDTIGTVGNSGNARLASPHLHFGIYRSGRRVALDPAPLLAGSGSPAYHADVDPGMLGRWATTTGDGVRLRNSPSLAGAILAELSAATPVLVLGGVMDWHRVLLPDGTTGFVSARFTAPADHETVMP